MGLGFKLMDEDDYRPQGATSAGAGQELTLQDDAYDEALKRLRNTATGESGLYTAAEIDAAAPDTVEWCRQAALRIVGQINDENLAARHTRAFNRPDEQVVNELLNDMFGLGPLQKLIEMPDVEDIAMCGPQSVFYKAKGDWVKSDITYRSPGALLYVLNHAVAHTQRTVSAKTPIVDAALKQGHRISIVGDPIAAPWPSAVIRIHRPNSLSAFDLVSKGGESPADGNVEPRPIPNYFEHDKGGGPFSALAMTFLHMSVIAGFNILVIGGTGVGKTSVINVLGSFLPADRRVVLIEDTPEIALQNSNWQRFVTRPPSLEGLPEVTSADLVRVGLRQRPDALFLGEARGGEILDLMKALRTGHRNGLTSIHANSVEDVYGRILFMLQEASLQTQFSEELVAKMVAKAFDLVLMLRKRKGRFVEEIGEFSGGTEGAQVVRQTLFQYDNPTRRLKCTGRFIDPRHEAMLRECGYSYEQIVSAARELC